jgi:hypothetical protein
LSRESRSRGPSLAELTQTEDNHVYADDDGAHRGWEELADTTKHHDHTHRDVDEPTGHIISLSSSSAHKQSGADSGCDSNGKTYKMLEKSILMIFGFVSTRFQAIFDVSRSKESSQPLGSSNGVTEEKRSVGIG